MEKLIELLNEAQKDVGLFWHCLGNCKRKLYAGGCWEVTTELDDDYNTYRYSDEDICSKRCGFIKWLVENDKLDEEELQYVGCDDMQIYYKDYERVIMQLSISDNPIQDLISLLK